MKPDIEAILAKLREHGIDPGELPGKLFKEKLRECKIDSPELYAQVPLPHRHLFAGFWCCADVVNGGFTQFFWNYTGVLAPEAVEGFRAIGLDDVADVVAKAMTFFGEPYPRDYPTRRGQLSPDSPPRWPNVVSEFFNKLDDQFYALLPIGTWRFENAADEYAKTF